jgi:hypothetical protein
MYTIVVTAECEIFVLLYVPSKLLLLLWLSRTTHCRITPEIMNPMRRIGTKDPCSNSLRQHVPRCAVTVTAYLTIKRLNHNRNITNISDVLNGCGTRSRVRKEA